MLLALAASSATYCCDPAVASTSPENSKHHCCIILRLWQASSRNKNRSTKSLEGADGAHNLWRRQHTTPHSPFPFRMRCLGAAGEAKGRAPKQLLFQYNFVRSPKGLEGSDFQTVGTRRGATNYMQEADSTSAALPPRVSKKLLKLTRLAQCKFMKSISIFRISINISHTGY